MTAAVAAALAMAATQSAADQSASHIQLTGVGTAAVPSEPTSAPAINAPPAFTIAGTVGGLYPGQSTVLPLKVSNPKAYAIVVHSITTTVGNASAGCTAANLTVGAFSGALTVPGRGSASTSVPIGLSHGAPDACQGATFHLQYTGSADKA